MWYLIKGFTKVKDSLVFAAREEFPTIFERRNTSTVISLAVDVSPKRLLVLPLHASPPVVYH